MNFARLPTIICGLLCLVGTLGQPDAAAQSRGALPSFDFKGRFLLVASDADMRPSAYLDGKLGPADGTDALTVIRLDRPGRELRPVAIPVSNSVTGPPAVVAVTPDGRYAVVIETRGPRPALLEPRLKDLPRGRALTVVDLADPDHPHVTQRLLGGEQPSAVSISADGSLVAVCYDAHGAGKTTPLALYRLRGGQLSGPVTPAVPGWAAGETIIDVEWHPTQNILALLNVDNPALTFVRVSEAGGELAVTPWGNSVRVEKGPFLARFAPDGRHVLVNSSYAAIDGVPALPGAGLRGSVQSVRLAAASAPDGSPLHQVAARADTAPVPEGLAISPDGRYAVTTNLEESTWALDSPNQGFFSSLTLLRLDPATGGLTRVGDFAFDGVLPEMAVFDNSSRFLAVANFTFFDPARKGGAIDFWRIAGSAFDPGRTELVKLDFSVPVARGPHSMVIVR